MSKKTVHGIYSSRLHAIMYSMLLVATPFLLLQNFLVEKISELSASSFQLGNTDIPLLPLLAAILAIALIIVYRSYLTRLRILAIVIVILMIALAQQITDYYFDHNFYDLQQNWHYLAYAIFAYMVYRDLAPRKMPLPKIMIITYLAALGFSTIDEIIQMHISSRVFDIGDIAKDLWGSLLGIVFLYLNIAEPRALASQWKRIRFAKVKDYLSNPSGLLVLMFVLAFLFLCFSSLLTEYEYWGYVVLFTIVGFTIFFALFHFSQKRTIKYIILGAFLAALIFQTYFFARHRSDYITHYRYGLTVYRGIPIPFFDIIIFPDGTFRPVDKKHFFNFRDKDFFLKRRPDIILIASGFEGKGGRGFPVNAPVQFIYNRYIERGTQVIILQNPQACQLFNRLKKEGKNVLFILHSTC